MVCPLRLAKAANTGAVDAALSRQGLTLSFKPWRPRLSVEEAADASRVGERRAWLPALRRARRRLGLVDQLAAGLHLFGRRASCHRFQANQLRLLLAALAYTLMVNLRRLALKGTELAQACTVTIHTKLLKNGAAVVRNTRRVRSTGRNLSSAWPARRYQNGPYLKSEKGDSRPRSVYSSPRHQQSPQQHHSSPQSRSNGIKWSSSASLMKRPG